MTNDRNYYRMLEDEELIELARESKDELAIVLGEMLLRTQRELEQIQERLSRRG